MRERERVKQEGKRGKKRGKKRETREKRREENRIVEVYSAFALGCVRAPPFIFSIPDGFSNRLFYLYYLHTD